VRPTKHLLHYPQGLLLAFIIAEKALNYIISVRASANRGGQGEKLSVLSKAKCGGLGGGDVRRCLWYVK
jgi:hypothetical protein